MHESLYTPQKCALLSGPLAAFMRHRATPTTNDFSKVLILHIIPSFAHIVAFERKPQRVGPADSLDFCLLSTPVVHAVIADFICLPSMSRDFEHSQIVSTIL